MPTLLKQKCTKTTHTLKCLKGASLNSRPGLNKLPLRFPDLGQPADKLCENLALPHILTCAAERWGLVRLR